MTLDKERGFMMACLIKPKLITCKFVYVVHSEVFFGTKIQTYWD